ncbi:MAG: TM0106 family RecB-like putative nuclease [Patescibacteria group bacterium]
MPKKDYLTATDFYRYSKCPHWPYYERFATKDEKKLKRALTDFEIKIMEDGVAHEERVVASLFEEQSAVEAPQTKDAEKDFKATLKLMKQGAPLIYQGTLTDKDWSGRPDLLERHEGTSALGEWYYVPVDVKSTHHIHRYQKMQLIFYSILLDRIQRRFPNEPAIINNDGERLSFEAREFMDKFEDNLQELKKIRAGEIPDPVLRKACHDSGPWGAACEKLAKDKNDIALIYKLDVRKLAQLREIGVRTVADAVVMDPAILDGAAPGLTMHGMEVAKMQAQALQNDAVFAREPVYLPEEGLEIHFDIESDLPNDVDYLYGFLIRGEKGDEYKPFVAERLEDEEKMWNEFLDWLETLPKKYTVYHYAPYEKHRLIVLENRYGGSKELERFRENMLDLKVVSSKSVVFPLYFYGLKNIAKFLGFEWKGDVTGGGQSIEVFEKYLDTGDRALLDSIIQYNEEDVRATAHLKDWLVEYASERQGYERPYPWSGG